jgi:hypothetical protein
MQCRLSKLYTPCQKKMTSGFEEEAICNQIRRFFIAIANYIHVYGTRNPTTLAPHSHCLKAFSYLCTYDLYSPVHNVLDACISITKACVRGLGTGNREFLGPCEMALSR